MSKIGFASVSSWISVGVLVVLVYQIVVPPIQADPVLKEVVMRSLGSSMLVAIYGVAILYPYYAHHTSDGPEGV